VLTALVLQGDVLKATLATDAVIGTMVRVHCMIHIFLCLVC
jgi:hypothetical protein